MGSANRFGTGLLGTFGLGLAGLMVYTLAFEGCRSNEGGSGAAAVSSEVAVFFPDRRDWSHFRHAVEVCVGRKLAKAVEDDGESVVVATPRHGRRVRFGWRGVRGVGETGDEVARSLATRPPPVAVVGSSTSVLTVALAEATREAGPSGPVLLIPWATALMAALPGQDRPVALLEIDPGRTFRFCPDNRRLAESVVNCLIDQGGGKSPRRAYVVVDPHDPYSIDLAGCFRAAIRARGSGVEVIDRPETLGVPSVNRLPGAPVVPSAEEVALADEAWSSAEGSGEGEATWVVLPLQGDPTRRMLAALRRRSTWRGRVGSEGPIRVVCGDGVGRETLDALAGLRSFPIWCASTASSRSPDHGVNNDTQALAEIASALLLAVDLPPADRPVSADAVRDALATLDLPATDARAFGRALAFEPDGERRGDPGHVLAVRPGSPLVAEFARGPDGRWVQGPEPRSKSGPAKGARP